MDQWCDPTGSIAKKAESLKGKWVRTSTWNPTIFDPLNWFRDIYEVAI